MSKPSIFTNLWWNDHVDRLGLYSDTTDKLIADGLSTLGSLQLALDSRESDAALARRIGIHPIELVATQAALEIIRDYGG